jgi:hypothetical protein
MVNFNFNRFILMTKKYLIELPIAFKVTPMILVIGTVILKIQFNDKFMTNELAGLYFGFLCALGAMGGAGSLGKDLRVTSNRIGHLQIPASPFEKALGLWASQLPFLLIVTGLVILGPETIITFYLKIFRIEPVSLMGFGTILVQIVFVNSILAISIFTLKTVKDIKKIVYGIPNIFLLPFYIRIFSPLMKSGFQIPLLLIEVLISVGCWYIIYRRIAYTQIK